MTQVLMVCMQIALAGSAGAQDSAGWTGVDVGNAGVAGLATYNANTMTWTVRGGGFDVEGIADSFHYVHGPLDGDGFIIAKVEHIGKADPWAKCGIMIRESTDPGSRFAAIFVTPGNGVRFQARVETGGNITHDTTVATKEQIALKAPVWIKLERKKDQFCGYYAADKRGGEWTPMVWVPQPITMSRIVHVGLAVCSHASGRLCVARFSNVAFPPIGEGIVDFELRSHRRDAVVKAYGDLEQLGDWLRDEEFREKHENLIARSLYTIARAKEIAGTPANDVLADYYRMTRLLPDAYLTIEALARISVLDGEKGLIHATRCLDAKPWEDKDRFYAAAMKASCGYPVATGKDAVVESFAQYTAKTSRFTAIEQIIADLGDDEQGISTCKTLIQRWMARPSDTKVAIVGLRYMAAKAIKGQAEIQTEPQAETQTDTSHIQGLLTWAASQFKGTKLSLCAMAALGDIYYTQRSYARVIEAFQPTFFRGNQSEAQKLESIESILASYQANTLLQGTVNLDRIYEAVSQTAGRTGHHVMDLHCQRKIAEMKGFSIKSFEESAQRGVKYSGSGPENEVWFWKGLIAASEGDLGAAVAAYERFLRKDNNSVLAARAYYDIARTKMAIGEDATAWITKAKALSPCDNVIQLERRLGKSAATRG